MSFFKVFGQSTDQNLLKYVYFKEMNIGYKEMNIEYYVQNEYSVEINQN